MADAPQPTKLVRPPRIFGGGGTSQAERLLAALLPEGLLLDERTLPQLLAYVARFSETVCFYEGGTGKPMVAGTWQLARHQPLLLLAKVAAYPGASLAARYAPELHPLSDAAAPAGARRRARQQLLHRLAEQVSTLTYWQHQQLPNQVWGFTSALQEAITQLKPALRQAAAAEHTLRAAQAAGGKAQLAKVYKLLFNEDLPAAHTSKNYAPGAATDAHVATATQELLALLDSTGHALVRVARAAGFSLQHALQLPAEHDSAPLPPKMPPEVALLVAVLQLYRQAQHELNAIPTRHLDFYYQQVLRTAPKPGQPDRAYLSFTLAKGVASYVLPKGTRIGGAKTPAGQPIVFATTHDATLAAWQVEALATLFVARTATGRIRGIYAAPPRDPATAGGPGAAAPGAPWPLFGEAQGPDKAFRTLPDARVGFAVADAVLVLSGGERHLLLCATATPTSFAQCQHAMQQAAAEEGEEVEAAWRAAFEVLGTGPAGWLPLTVLEVVLDAATHSVRWLLRLPASQPALTGYDAAKHGPGFATHWPVVQFTLNPQPGAYAYQAGAALHLTSLRLNVWVAGLRQLALANQQGELKAGQPFAPFGARAQTMDYLLLGAPELVGKNLHQVQLRLCWQHLPGSLADYYAGYGQPITNESFQVCTACWVAGGWQSLAKQQALFKTGFSGRLLHDKSLDFGQPGPCGSDPTGHQLRVQLVAPAWGFGDTLYPQALASTALYNAGLVSQAATAKMAGRSPGPVAASPPAAPASLVDPAPSPAAPLPLPQPPLILLAQDALLDYQAEAELHPGQSPAADTGQFYYLQPFAITQPAAPGPLPLLPPVSQALPPQPAQVQQGTLLVGLSASAAGQVVELLFELLVPMDAGASSALPAVQWAYLAGEQWIAAEQPAYLGQPLPGFGSTCRVQVRLPAGLPTEHQQLPSGLCWLRGTVAAGAAAFGKVHAWHGPLVLAERVLPAADFSPALLAGQLRQPVPALPAIAKVQQPLPSFGGLPAETSAAHRLRISERLRHRQRALTPWDYEHLLLAQFPEVHSAYCLPAAQAPPPWVPGRVVVVALPQPGQPGVLPLLGAGQLTQMQRALQKLAPAAVQLEVRNPCYEQVQIRATVTYQAPHLPALVPYDQQLQHELNHFLSPWHQDDPRQGGFHHHLTLPAVQAFISSRPYVQQVSGLSAVKTALIDGEHRFYDSFHDPTMATSDIGPTSAWAVLVPAPHHQLSTATAAQHAGPAPAQPTGIGDLAVGEGLSVAAGF